MTACIRPSPTRKRCACAFRAGERLSHVEIIYLRLASTQPALRRFNARASPVPGNSLVCLHRMRQPTRAIPGAA